MATIATGQISIVDYNDSLTLTGFISSNHPKTQQYNPDNGTFTPNWSTTNLVLTPSLFKLGVPGDIIGSAQVESIKWFEASNPTIQLQDGATYGIPTSGLTLTVKTNVLSNKAAIDYICEVGYRDSTTGMLLTNKMGISFNKVVNGGGIADAVAWAPDGNIFKNDSINSLIVECDLWRGSLIDTTNVTYQWYKKDTSVLTDIDGGGIGWRKATMTGNTTRKMTVLASDVTNIAILKCIITDIDSSSNTYNQTFEDTVTVIDQSDPIQIDIFSDGGNIFKNGIGETTLTARVFRSGEEIDEYIEGKSTYIYTYKWYKYNKARELDVNFGGTGVSYKTGKRLDVGSDDVDVKATFVVEIS